MFNGWKNAAKDGIGKVNLNPSGNRAVNRGGMTDRDKPHAFLGASSFPRGNGCYPLGDDYCRDGRGDC